MNVGRQEPNRAKNSQGTNSRTGGQRPKDRRPPFFLTCASTVTCPSHADAAVACMVSEPLGVYVHIDCFFASVWLFSCILLLCDAMLFAWQIFKAHFFNYVVDPTAVIHNSCRCFKDPKDNAFHRSSTLTWSPISQGCCSGTIARGCLVGGRTDKSVILCTCTNSSQI